MPIRLHVKNDVVRVEWDGSPDDAELESFFDDLAAVVSRLSRYALIYDARRASAPSTSQRHLLADMSRILGAAMRERCVGAAFVIESAMVRAALVAVLWLAPMEVPYVVSASLDEAKHWSRAQLSASRPNGS